MTAELRHVDTPPPLLLGLLRQTQPDLESYLCQTCDGTGRVYRSRFASRDAACDECFGQGRIDIPGEAFDGGAA